MLARLRQDARVILDAGVDSAGAGRPVAADLAVPAVRSTLAEYALHLIVTGPGDTNVGDIQVILFGPD